MLLKSRMSEHIQNLFKVDISVFFANRSSYLTWALLDERASIWILTSQEDALLHVSNH